MPQVRVRQDGLSLRSGKKVSLFIQADAFSATGIPGTAVTTAATGGRFQGDPTALEDLTEMNASSRSAACEPGSRRAGAGRFSRELSAGTRFAGILLGAACLVPGLTIAQEYSVSDLPDEPAPIVVGEESLGDSVLVGDPVQGMPVLVGDPILEEQGGMPQDAAGQDLAVDPGQWNSTQSGDEAGISEYTVSDWGSNWGSVAAEKTRCPNWVAQVDALFLFLGNVPSRTLYINDATGASALNLTEANPAMSAAPRYAVIWNRDACRAFELNYFSVGSFYGISESIAPDGETFSSQNIGGAPFNDILGAGVETTSGIKSWEFNLRRNNGGSITWIGGFRWVQWNQQLFTAGVFDSGAGELLVDAYATETGNNLYGGQFGADMMLWNRGNRFKVNGLAKGGVYYNYQAFQRSSYLDGTTGEVSSIAAAKDTTSFVGEVGLVGEYRLTNWLSWRAGYTVFWLGGVANAANQLSLSDFSDPAAPTTSISPYSSVLLHGATTGLEARW